MLLYSLCDHDPSLLSVSSDTHSSSIQHRVNWGDLDSYRDRMPLLLCVYIDLGTTLMQSPEAKGQNLSQICGYRFTLLRRRLPLSSLPFNSATHQCVINIRMSTHIKWFLAHQPVELVRRTAQSFRDLIEAATDGEFQIEILEPHEYAAKYDPALRWGPRADGGTGVDVMPLLQSGAVEMSQADLYELGGESDPDYYLFDTPFLFASHEHAGRVINGEIGQELNDRLTRTERGFHGLAYTYSGGYRALGAVHPVDTIHDLKGRTIRVNANPVTQEYWRELGFDTKRISEVSHAALDMADAERMGVEVMDTTYIRFQPAPHWYKTLHSLYLTDILVSDQFWSTLSPELKTTWRACATKAAEQERGWAQQDAREYERTARERGCTIVDASQDDIQHMQAHADRLTHRWEDEIFSRDLLKRIRLSN